MTWFDVVAIVLILLIAWLESLRGFGRAIFDFVGGLLGCASGVIVAHIFIRILLVAYASTDFGSMVLNSFVGQEVIMFRSYHAVVHTLQNLGNW